MIYIDELAAFQALQAGVANAEENPEVAEEALAQTREDLAKAKRNVEAAWLEAIR